MKIYVASSWRNTYQSAVVNELRNAGHEVYDFRHPYAERGFQWSDVDKNWQNWNFTQYHKGLKHDEAESGFKRDFDAMKWADVCVLVLPCGRSAHMEAGWMKGAGKTTFIYIPEMQEPELMYKLSDEIYDDLGLIIERLKIAGSQIYFGTAGCTGHQIKCINFQMDSKYLIDLEDAIDSESWIKIIESSISYYHHVETLAGVIYSVLAVPFSADDSRPGSHTEFWWEGEHSERELLSVIHNNEFLERQFAGAFRRAGLTWHKIAGD